MAQQAKHLFARIVKVDAAKRTVSGIAMQEIVDRTNEKCLYEESKPYFQAWSSNQEKASGGKSKGNLRAMHTAKVAGIVTDLVCDDNLKAFLIDTEIVADDEWALVEKGAYTGFSIGANFATDANGKKLKSVVNGVLEWVANPVEVSLVDTPCVPSALFEMKYADGHSEMRKFSSTIDREKGMYSVSQMASALQDIRYLWSELDWEAQYENDGSKIPDRLRDWMTDGASIFLDLAEEETSEFAQMINAQKAARADRVTKQEKAAPAVETDDMTPEQQKSFDAGIETLKSIAPTLEALKGVPDSLKAISTAQTAQGETLKSFDLRLTEVETQNKAFAELTEGIAELEKSFGGQPEPVKVKTVAITPEADALKAAQAAQPAPVELAKSTNPQENQEARIQRMKGIHATDGKSGAGFAGDRGEFSN